jgi:hypothetical protein
MSKVLICKNDRQIQGELENATKGKIYLQEVYNAFSAINIMPTLDDMSECLNALRNHYAIDELENWVLEYYTQNIENPNIEGIPLSRDKLKSIIENPNCSTLYDKISLFRWNSFDFRVTNGLDLSFYYVVEDGQIELKENISETLTEMYSSYAETAKEQELLSKINLVVDACTEFYEYAKNKNLEGYSGFVSMLSNLPFLDQQNGTIALTEKTVKYIKQNSYF